jgi:polyphenol oxidase
LSYKVTNFLVPDWPAPEKVKALVTTRQGGVSAAPWASFNLGDHVGDDPSAVRENRSRLRKVLPTEPKWLRQVHGTLCVDVSQISEPVDADASFTRQPGIVCSVLTADCLPVFFCDDQASVVAVAHAGWRGLANGVLESTVSAMQINPARLMAFMGPAIGPEKFEVGPEVRETLIDKDESASRAFVATTNGKWLADIYLLAWLRLRSLGIERVFGPASKSGKFESATTNCCTVSQSEQFFSYRRDGVTGRMASCIWLASGT